MNASSPVKVAVTGAAGAIGYSLLFRIASGQMLGEDTPVELSLLEIPQAVKAAEGVAMELDDCAFPLLARVDISDDPNYAFDGVQVALLVGARPRTQGHGALATCSRRTAASSSPRARPSTTTPTTRVRVLVVGNPANTNALIAMSNAPDVPRERFTAMTRLDHNRAIAQLANKLQVPVADDHQHDDLGQPLGHAVPRHLPREGERRERRGAVDDQAWLEDDFIPTVQKRGAAIIEARGASSAASAANAAIDHVRDWMLGTPEGDWVSMAIPSDGSYGVEEGIISSFPVHHVRRPLRGRPGPRDRRLLAGAHRRNGRRAQGRARRGERARPRVTRGAA